MEICFKCGNKADYICPECGVKACKVHMELRYRGPDRGLKSRLMCPRCWKKKQVVLNENMVDADQYKPKTYIYQK